jgi:hypothetical protein
MLKPGRVRFCRAIYAGLLVILASISQVRDGIEKLLSGRDGIIDVPRFRSAPGVSHCLP